MSNFSYFDKPVTNIIPLRDTNTKEIYKLIKGNNFKNETRILREKVAANVIENEQAEYKQNNFDFATFSATFKKRSIGNIDTYSSLITIDIDHLSKKDLETNLEIFRNDEYTHLMFVSPRGAGIKLIFLTNNTDYRLHKNYYSAIRKYIGDKYKIEVDKSGSDVPRPCFLPHDPDVYYNRQSKIWKDFVEKKSKKIDFERFDLLKLDDYDLKEMATYYITECPACGKGEAYIYKDGFQLRCSHKSCGFVKELVEKSNIDTVFESLEKDKKNDAIRRDFFKLLSFLDEFDRPIYFGKLAKLYEMTKTEVKQYYNKIIAQETEREKETQYVNADFKFNNPPDWQHSNSGIMYDNKKMIVNHPLYINGIGNDRSGNIFVEIRYGKNAEKNVYVGKKLISTKEITTLAEKDIMVNSENASDIIKFFQAWYQTNYDIFPRFEIVNQCGWFKDKFILPEKILSENGTDKNIKYVGVNVRKESYRGKGKIKDWLKILHIINDLDNAHVAKFMIYAAFTAPVLDKLNSENFIVHLFGKTSSGKSTVLRILASIFGTSSMGEDSQIKAWESTKNFHIRIAEELKNLPLFLDELSGKNIMNVSDIIYQLGNGVGKGKASYNDPMAVAEQRTFCTGTFSTGEPPILADGNNRGLNIRAWEIDQLPFGSSSVGAEIKAIEALLEENYGLAFEPFINEFFKKRDMYDQEYEIIDRKLSNEEERVMKIIKLIYVTGLIISDLFKLDWNIKSDISKVFDLISEKLEREDGENSTGAEFFEIVKQRFRIHESNFVNIKKGYDGKFIYENGKNYTLFQGLKGYIIEENDEKKTLAWVKSDFLDEFTDKKGVSNGNNMINIMKQEGIIREKRKQIKIKNLKIDYIFFENFFSSCELGDENDENEGKMAENDPF